MVKRRFLTGFLVVLACWVPAGRCLADVSGQLEQAEAYADQEEYEQAEGSYKQILAENADGDVGLAAQQGLVIVYDAWHKRKEAEAAFEELVSKFSEHKGIAKAIDKIADEHRQSGRYREARELYEYIVEHWPQADHAVEAQRGVIVASIKLRDELSAEAGINKLLTDFSEHPGLIKILDSLADSYRSLGNAGKARELYQYVVEHWPESERAAEAQSGVIRSWIALGDEAKAEAAIDTLLRDFGQSEHIAKAVALVGNYYRFVEKPDKALELYKLVVDRWPQAPDAMQSQANAAVLYMSAGDDPNAEAAIEKLLRDYGQGEAIAERVREIAVQYSELGRQDKGAELFRQVLTRWPQSDEAILAQQGLVTCRIRQWDLDGAEAELGNLLSDFASHEELTDAVHEIVEEYRNTGAHEESRELFHYLLENWYGTDETMLELQVGVALQSIKLREPNKADAAVQRLIADYKDHPRIAKGLFQIAEQHYYAGDCVRAGDLWKRVLVDYPQSSFESKNETPYLIATCCRALGKPEEAIRYYKVSIEKYPQGRYTCRAPYRLALEYRRAGDPNEALYWLDKQRELYTEELHSQRALFEYAAVYHWDLKDYEKAIEACEDYLAEYPEDEHTWPAYYLWAKSLEKLDKKSEAIAVLQEALAHFAGTELEQRISEAVTRIEEGGEK